jgi:transcriptional regulator with XRE-family HTH domain
VRLAEPAAALSAPDSAAESLGRRLRCARLRAGLTQAGLGAAVARPQSLVARWERDRLEPRLGELVRLAVRLAVPLEELLEAPSGAPRRRSGRGRDLAAARRLGLSLRAARVDAGLDPIVLARRARLTPRRLRQVEQGADPSLDEVRRLRRAVGWTLQDVERGRNLDSVDGLDTLSPTSFRRRHGLPPSRSDIRENGRP